MVKGEVVGVYKVQLVAVGKPELSAKFLKNNSSTSRLNIDVLEVVKIAGDEIKETIKDKLKLASLDQIEFSPGTPTWYKPADKENKPVVKADTQPVAKNMSSTYRINPIPTWDGRTDSESIKRVTLSLEKAKSLLAGNMTDEALVFAFLSNNNKMEIYQGLSLDAAKSVEKFNEYLLKNFGSTGLRKVADLQSIKQNKDENEAVFFNRVLRAVHDTLSKAVPDKAENVDAAEKLLIKHYFIEGLKSNRVKEHIRTEYSTGKFEELPMKARDFAWAVQVKEPRQEEVAQVVSFRGRDKTDVVCYNCNERGHIAKYCRSESSRGRNGDKFRNITCHNCGYKGHIAANCR